MLWSMSFALSKYSYQSPGKDEDFWKHEYNTHGTCEISDLDEEAYFAATLELNDRYPIEVLLSSREPALFAAVALYLRSAYENCIVTLMNSASPVRTSCRQRWRRLASCPTRTEHMLQATSRTLSPLPGVPSLRLCALAPTAAGGKSARRR